MDIHPDLKSVKSGNLSTISLGDVSYSYERRDNRVSFLCSTIDNTSDDSTGLLSLCCWISEKTIENGSWQNEYYELVDSIELGSLKKDYSFSDIEQTFVIPDDLLTIIDSMNEEKDEWHFVFTINELDEDGNNHIIFAVNGPDENEGIKLSIYDESLSIFKDNDDEIRAFVDGEEFSGTLVSSDERFEMEFEESIPVFLRGYHKNGQCGVGGSLDPTLVPLNVVVADKVCYYDCDLTPAGDYLLGQMADNPLYFECDKELVKELTNTTTTLTVRKGTIISGDSFGTHKNMTAELLKHFDNPLVVDMESAACGQVALRLNVPFVVIRSISDNIIDDEKCQADIYEEYLEMSAKRAASVLVHYLNKDMLED